MKNENHDAELADGDEAADDRDDERHEIPEARGEEEVCRRAHEERKSRRKNETGSGRECVL